MNPLFKKLAARLYDGDAEGVVSLTKEALQDGTAAAEILNQGLMVGMERVGVDFKDGELFVPEIVVAARAMHAGIEELKQFLMEGQLPVAGKIVLGTVKGDVHDIGKKLVGIMMQGAGFEVIDLGHDVAPEAFVDAVKKHQPQLLGMSALLSTTMPMMKATIERLDEAGVMGQLKILVGGAPVTSDWATEIGAHGWAPDAVSAVTAAKELLQ